jgi:uncharacterized protein (TIGR02466 family)
MLNDYKIIPAFPSVIGATHIKQDISAIWNDIDNIEFSKSTGDNTAGFVSKKMRLLNEYPEIKKILFDEFNKFKDECLKLKDTNFNITTSWMTMTPTRGFCQHHHHKNSYYSAVLYEKPTNDIDSGNLILIRPTLSTLLPNEPEEHTILNSDQIIIEPDTNLIVFFPSYLYHRINMYTGKENRYSIAFNLFPVGELNHGDSSLELEAG